MMEGRRDMGSLYLVATPRTGMPEGEFLERVHAAMEGVPTHIYTTFSLLTWT